MGMRTPHPPPKGPAEGGARGKGRLDQYAHRRGVRDRTGPSKPASTPIHRTFAHPSCPKHAHHKVSRSQSPAGQSIV